jgi:hypothetical protein
MASTSDPISRLSLDAATGNALRRSSAGGGHLDLAPARILGWLTRREAQAAAFAISGAAFSALPVMK